MIEHDLRLAIPRGHFPKSLSEFHSDVMDGLFEPHNDNWAHTSFGVDLIKFFFAWPVKIAKSRAPSSAAAPAKETRKPASGTSARQHASGKKHRAKRAARKAVAPAPAKKAPRRFRSTNSGAQHLATSDTEQTAAEETQMSGSGFSPKLHAAIRARPTTQYY